MKLKIRFTACDPAELNCGTMVLLTFSDKLDRDRALFGSGWPEDFFTGSEGETLLLSIQDRIPSKTILLKGLGAAGTCTLESLGRRLEEVGDALQKMSVTYFGIRVPPVESTEAEYPRQLELTCRHLLKPFLARHRNEADIAVRVYVCVGENLDRLTSTIRLLETHFRPLLPCSVGLEDDPARAAAHESGVPGTECSSPPQP